MIINLYRGDEVTGELCLTKEEYEHLISKGAIQIFRPWQLSRRDRPRKTIRGYAKLDRKGNLMGLTLDEVSIQPPNHVNCRCVIPVVRNKNKWP